MKYLGIDIGSTTSKCVIVDDRGKIVGVGLSLGGAGTKGPERSLKMALDNAALIESDIDRTCATGYGRNLIQQADMQHSELSCHAKGASRLFPTAHTVIDIGGQDAKVLKLDDQGNLENFVMNDKCAAGTGRFLDVMANVLGIRTDELSNLDKNATGVASVSSTCTVFAESEVISKLASGVPMEDIVAGVHASVADRTYGLVRRLGVTKDVAMTGGVALNEGLRHRLEARIGEPILTCSIAQYNGAFGAALYALEA
jgi:predicted CoA-substrate-specific enzyme activase